MKKIFKYLFILPLLLFITFFSINSLNLNAEEDTLTIYYSFPQNDIIGEMFNVEYAIEPKEVSKSSDNKYYVILPEMTIDNPKLEFDGWYYDSEFTNKANKQDTFTTDGITLWGKFNIDTSDGFSEDFRLFKNKDSNLFINDITNLYKTLLLYNFDSVKVKEDNYTGNAATIGEKTITYELKSGSTLYEETITVNVLSGLKCNYIFNNTIYINSSHDYTKSELVSDLKLIGDLSSTTSLNINIYSDYYDVTEKKLEYDDLNIVYSSSDGTQGNLNYNLKLVNQANYDLIEEEQDDYLVTGLLILFVVLVIFIVYSVFNSSPYKRKYRR